MAPLRRTAAAALGLAAAAILAAPAARGDVVEFRNGRTLEGEILEETETSVTLRVEGGKVSFPKSLVASIRKGPAPEPAKDPSVGEFLDAAPLGTKGSRKPGPTEEAAGVPVAKDEWLLLWSGEKRAGWRRSQALVGPDRALFEEETTLLGPDGRPRSTTRIVEEAGPGFAPISFLVVQDSADRSFTRIGRVAGGRLLVETYSRGEKTERDHAVPAGFLLPLAARARVLRDPALAAAGWVGDSYDARRGEFVRLSLRVERRERAAADGETVDAVLLARQRGGEREEERIALDGRLIAGDFDGGALAAVRSSRERIEAFRSGVVEEAGAEDRRARPVFVSPEDGFRVRKPGLSWEFVAPESRDAKLRVTVKDPTGLVEVRVESEPCPGDGDPPLPALGASAEKRVRDASTEFARVEDGFAPFAGGESYRLLADATQGGDRVRLLVVALVRGGRVWTLTARAPHASWGEARPYLDRILAGFEWL